MNLNYMNFSNTTIFEDGPVPVIKSKRYQDLDDIGHGFSTRLGGVSQGIYASMNLSFTRGDREEAVLENFHRMGKALQMEVDHMVYAHQTHTNKVLVVDSSHRGMGVVRERSFQDVDGLVTKEPGVVLVTSYADCVPLFLVDPVKRAIGLSHSGWRGTVTNIAAATIESMKLNFQSNPRDLLVFIGPSICRDCYEIGEDVAEEFTKVYGAHAFEGILFPKPNRKYHLDLQEANRRNFKEAGVQNENISITDLCTCCNPSILYSHRASNGERGGLCGFLALR